MPQDGIEIFDQRGTVRCVESLIVHVPETEHFKLNIFMQNVVRQKEVMTSYQYGKRTKGGSWPLSRYFVLKKLCSLWVARTTEPFLPARWYASW